MQLGPVVTALSISFQFEEITYGRLRVEHSYQIKTVVSNKQRFFGVINDLVNKQHYVSNLLNIQLSKYLICKVGHAK